MSKHTPGPWKFYEWHPEWASATQYVIAQADGAEYTSGYSDVAETIGGETDVQLANARLIAAAPELLEAAILGLSISESWINERYSGERYEKANEALNPIRAAIAKARGEA